MAIKGKREFMMDDLISRQAAIDAIKTWGLIDGLSEGQAIEILADEEKLPSVQPEILACGEGELNVPDTNVGDTISRQDAIDSCHNYEDGKDAYAYGYVVEERLKALPSTQPSVITCDGCRHVGTYDTDFPCSGCIRREKDYYEQER